MANIAIRDADIIVALANWGPGHFDIVYHGKNYEAWRQDAAMAIIENPDLRQAMTTADGKMSLIRALQRSASTGLSLNPQKGESALVPIQGKINFWPMKNGMIKEALATGSLEFVESNTIFANDEFKIKKTAKGDDYEFSPALKERGPSVAYFAVAALKSGRTVVVYMPR
jgi:recombinational DNA repair protein RecT